MLNESMIEEFPGAQSKYFISDFSVRSSDRVIVLYVPSERVSEVAKKGFVSKNQLNIFAKKLAKKYSAITEIIYIQTNKIEQLEQGVELLLKSKFSDTIEEANFTLISASEINAWIKVENVSDSQKQEIERFLQSVFLDSGVTAINFQWIGEVDRLPSFVEILAMTKRLQPALLNMYVLKFSKDFCSINEKWLNRQLDKLIKKGMIVRDRATEEYSLTGKGLGVIPDSWSRTNSDISRALDLGRKKW